MFKQISCFISQCFFHPWDSCSPMPLSTTFCPQEGQRPSKQTNPRNGISLDHIASQMWERDPTSVFHTKERQMISMKLTSGKLSQHCSHKAPSHSWDLWNSTHIKSQPMMLLAIYIIDPLERIPKGQKFQSRSSTDGGMRVPSQWDNPGLKIVSKHANSEDICMTVKWKHFFPLLPTHWRLR